MKLAFKRRLEALRRVEADLERRHRVEKALVGIALRYPSVNLKDVVKHILVGDYPVVEGTELHHDLAAPLGRALESYPDESIRREDLRELLAKWNARARSKVLRVYSAESSHSRKNQ